MEALANSLSIVGHMYLTNERVFLLRQPIVSLFDSKDQGTELKFEAAINEEE
ncbi:hypothetical protein HAX54_034219, partial [Datura stramonium]|nr:hypothetical protein [Datura stramonium]